MCCWFMPQDIGFCLGCGECSDRCDESAPFPARVSEVLVFGWLPNVDQMPTHHVQGEPLSTPMVTLVTNALQYYLSLAEVAKEESY